MKEFKRVVFETKPDKDGVRDVPASSFPGILKTFAMARVRHGMHYGLTLTLDGRRVMVRAVKG